MANDWQLLLSCKTVIDINAIRLTLVIHKIQILYGFLASKRRYNDRVLELCYLQCSLLTCVLCVVLSFTFTELNTESEKCDKLLGTLVNSFYWSQ